jgi:hypothetical protein
MQVEITAGPYLSGTGHWTIVLRTGPEVVLHVTAGRWSHYPGARTDVVPEDAVTDLARAIRPYGYEVVEQLRARAAWRQESAAADRV